MLTSKGEQAFDFIFESFRDHYIKTNPGVNGNDVERAFLYAILRTTYKTPQEFVKASFLIEEIVLNVNNST